MILSACSGTPGGYPSLQPRASEAIDPRVPVIKPMNNRPASIALKDQLADLVAQANAGNTKFDLAASEAERLAAAAGARQSESWIAAEESLTAAIAARKPTTTALGDIDEIGAKALQTQRGMAPNDLAAIKRAATEVGLLDRQQADRIEAIQKRLGI
jgi:hypothetical protein